MDVKPLSESILEKAWFAVLATNERGVVTFINRAASRLLGVEAADVLGQEVTASLPQAGGMILDCLRSGTGRASLQVLARDRTLGMRVELLDGAGGRGAVCFFAAVEHDASSGMELESSKNLNRQLKAIIESSSDGIWVCDGGARVISINGASEKMNGVRSDEIVGRTIPEIMAEGLFDRSVTLEALETGRQVSVIQHIRRTGNTLLVTGTPVFDEKGRIFLVVVNERDMTQLNRIREELEHSRAVTEKYRDELAELSLLALEKQEIVADSESMRQVLQVALKLARLDASNILLLGESGTGKGLLAQFVHKNGRRSRKPFIQINCAALPETLLEAELFGYEKGAFTGARAGGKAGLFELAQGGTLFLDEIGDLPLPLQAKLLKYLDDHEVMRLGSLKPNKVDCTVIAATNQDLDTLTQSGRFRRDLLYRLNTFTIRIPALRERREDIFELTHHFLRRYNRAHHLKRRISPEALALLQSHDFPGNVRELKSIIKRAALLSERDVLDEAVIGSLGGSVSRRERDTTPTALGASVALAEREVLMRAASRCRTTRELARSLGVSQPTVVRKLRKHGVSLSDSSLNQKERS